MFTSIIKFFQKKKETTKEALDIPKILILEDITDKSVLLLLFTLNTIFFALIADMIHRTSKWS